MSETQSSASLDQWLVEFASAQFAHQHKQALTALIASKQATKVSEDARFTVGLKKLLETAETAQDDEERLLSLAELVRISQVVKRFQVDLPGWVLQVMANPLPPLQVLKEADDRLNVARAMTYAQGSWVRTYLADAITGEEQGENAREVLIAALNHQSEALSELLNDLATSILKIRPDTESPGDSLARRLTRIFAALRFSVANSEIEAGLDVGANLLQLVSQPLRQVGLPKEERVKLDLAREVIQLTHEIVRSRFSIATDPETFRAVAYCRKMIGENTWPQPLQEFLALLINDIREALILLGRQGVRDQLLLDQLKVLCNYPQRAKAIAKDIAERHPEMDEATRDWLIKGRVVVRREASASAVEAAARKSDESIGLALCAARDARQASQAAEPHIVAALEIYEPQLVSVTQDVFKRFEAVIIQLDQTAASRELVLFGAVGQQVEYAPKFFEILGNAPRQKMVVKVPAVVRMRRDGAVGEVVVKGILE